MGKSMQMPVSSSCEVCGNNQDHCFEVHLGGERHVFDSFECAIRGLLPKCDLCGGLILGPGIQIENTQVCSYMCASLYSTQEIYVRRDIEARSKF